MTAPATRVRRRAPRRRLLIRVDPERIQLDLIRDTLRLSEPATWLRRAEDIEWAAPRPGDFTGRANDAGLELRRQRCQLKALNCRRHAWLLKDPEPGTPIPDELLGGNWAPDWGIA